MIGQVRGVILEKKPPQLIVDVQGIGYEIDAPMSTFFQLPEVGKTVQLFTHFTVREDAHQLFGFYTKDERQLFRTLLKVNGVGPRLALTILSSVKVEGFVQAVIHNDVDSLTKIQGIGKKTADRLLIEMRDKLSEWSHQSQLTHTPNQVRHQIIQDAISALITLGYKQPEANRYVTKIDDGKLSSEELIKRALREMM